MHGIRPEVPRLRRSAYFQGIHVEEATPASLRVLSGKASKRDGLFVVPVEIRGNKKGRGDAFAWRNRVATATRKQRSRAHHRRDRSVWARDL